MIRNTLLAAAMLAALGASAHADPVYWSVNAGVPGVVANWGNVVVSPPVVVAQPPVVYYPQRYVPAYRWGYPGPWYRGGDRGYWRHGRGEDDDDD